MLKNSFTILETLISITILSIVISGFYYSTYYDKNSQENFMTLNRLDNIFNTNSYKSFPKQAKQIKVIMNENIEKNINIIQYQYFKNNIKLIKYEK